MKLIQSITCLLAAVLSSALAPEALAIVIAKAGSPQASIVLAPGSSIAEQHAAAELASFLEQVTGSKFPIIEAPRDNASDICVGRAAAKALDPRFSVDDLGSDGLVIRTVNDDLILAGGEPRGTLYAVYTFLEEVGCRWWTPQASSIPKKPDLAVADLDRRYAPPYEHRDPLIAPYTLDPDWAVRNKCVGELPGYGHFDIMPERGGCRKAHPAGHSYFAVLPPEKYFDKHPDWYSLINGKRTATPRELASLCVTNPEMQQEYLRNLKEMIRTGPDAYPPAYSKRVPNPLMFVSVTPDDDSGLSRCQCERCLAVEKAEGSPAGPALRFANAMARALRSEFPDKTITMYAYHHTIKPPKITRPEPNVIIYFCPIHAASGARPMTDPRFKRWADDLNGWLKISKRVYVYDYPDNVTYELVPHPNLRALAANIKNWAEAGVNGYFGDGYGRGTGGSEMAELRAWLIARLLWDPSADPDKLIAEFADGYYGPAGRHIVAYLNGMHDAVEISGDWLDLSSPPDAQFLSLETLMDGWSHLKSAEAAVKDDPAILARVRVAQLPVLYVFLVRWQELKDAAACRGVDWPLPASRPEALKIFNDIVQSNHITPSETSQNLLAKSGT